MNGNTPLKKFNAGAISVAVWENSRKDGDGEENVSYGIQLERSYKDGDGNWKRTGSLRLNDIPKAVLLLNKAYEHVVLPDQGTSQ